MSQKQQSEKEIQCVKQESKYLSFETECLKKESNYLDDEQLESSIEVDDHKVHYPCVSQDSLELSYIVKEEVDTDNILFEDDILNINDGDSIEHFEGKAKKNNGKLKKEKSKIVKKIPKPKNDEENLTENSHNKTKRYKCKICSNTYVQKCHLSRHMNTHTGDKSYKCETCGRTFNRSDVLKNHQTTHIINHKIYKCDICAQTFNVKYNLVRHMATHTGDKNNKCLECGRAFYQFTDLQRHVRKHTREKPFECHLCPASYSRQYYLVTHNLTHRTGENPFQCDVCHHNCKSRRALIDHMCRTKHRQIMI